MSRAFIGRNKRSGMRGEGKKRTSRGGQRIEIASINDKPRRHMTFKKRRNGLFKIASELCVLCGVNVAILIFSSVGKLFCFGFPNVDAVVSDFLQGRPSLSSFNPTSNISDYASMLHKYNSEYRLVKQKIKRSSDDGSDHENNGGFWWDRSKDGLEINEMDQYSKSLEGLRDNVVTDFSSASDV